MSRKSKPTHRTEIINTPAGPVKATISEDREGPKRIRNLNDTEQKWLDENLRRAERIIRNHILIEDSMDPFEPRVLDTACAAWMQQHDEGMEDPKIVIHAFGVALGQYLVDQLGVEFGVKWVIVIDSKTKTIAVQGPSEELLTYPLSVALKRFERKETEFFVPIHHAIRENMKNYSRA